MAVIHILKDGSRLNDITNHVVKISDAGPVYQLIKDINRKEVKKYEKIK